MRRVRAVPITRTQAALLNIGVSLTRSSASSGASAAAAVVVEPEVATEPTCAIPVAMRWRWLHYRFDGAALSYDLVPDSDPPVYAYYANDFHGPNIVTAEGYDFDAGSAAEIYDAWTDDSVVIPNTDGGSNPPGTLIVELIDSEGNAIDGLRNYELGCEEGEDVEGALYEPFSWAIQFEQFAGAEPGVPLVTLDSEWRVVVYFPLGLTSIAGTLTISATDNVSEGGPYEFGPLVVTIGSPP